ncbi:hypothetical protein UYSO10_2070 [Kosakonia radicincitans]|nr:hypothetical protein UYSO10_2070 [Kosakonia radicincitans]
MPETDWLHWRLAPKQGDILAPFFLSQQQCGLNLPQFDGVVVVVVLVDVLLPLSPPIASNANPVTAATPATPTHAEFPMALSEASLPAAEPSATGAACANPEIIKLTTKIMRCKCVMNQPSYFIGTFRTLNRHHKIRSQIKTFLDNMETIGRFLSSI